MRRRRLHQRPAACVAAAIALLTACGATSRAPPPAIQPVELSTFVDSIIRREMAAQHILGAAFVYVENGRVAYARGYGLANADRNVPVDPDSTLFRIGSISKLFTATALVQLADRGAIALDADVNRYLHTVAVPASYPVPVTPAHLLTHTAGFDEIRPGTRAESEAGVASLGDFLRTRLVRVRPPGVVPAYSTYGVTLAGLVIEEVSGTPFEEYLRTNIWHPLGMTRTGISLTPELRRSLAPGYEFSNGRFVEQPYEWYHTTPASSINATASDMGRFLLAHLQDGALGTARILSASAARGMRDTHARGHPDVPGMAYGFFEADDAAVRIVEHFGAVAGVSSALVLFPDARSGFFLASHGESSTLGDSLKLAIVRRYHARPVTPPRLTALSAADAAPFRGTYRWNVYCHSCGRPAPTSGPRVERNADGTLSFAGQRWTRTGPLRFQRMDGARMLGFRADSSGHVTHLFIDGALTFERVF